MIKSCLHCQKTIETKTSRKFCNDKCRGRYKPPGKLSRNQQVGRNVSSWRRALKQKAVDYKGGKCLTCGYDRCNSALDFHHLDPNEKDFGIASNGKTRSWDKVKSELDKCVLLCRNCHAEVHAGLITLEVNNGSTNSNC